MTKEEAIKVIRHMAYLSAHVVENGVEAYEYIEQFLSKPSLPSNLEDAAKEYADYNSRRWQEDGDIYYDHSKIMDAFKAGAEWMAGQGYTKEGIARPDDCEIWVNLTDTDIRDGDKVIVQVRKKGT